MVTILRNIIKVTDGLWYKNSCFALSRNYGSSSKVELPSPPKKPLTAYMIFCRENRKELLKENPALSNPQQIKILAEKWSHLTEDMKKPYEMIARESTQVYGVEHKKFYEGLTEEQKEELARLKAKKLQSRRLFRNKKALREAGFPKAPTSAYAIYVQAEAKKNPAIKSASEFIKKVAESWNSLSAESKKAFEVQAEQDKVRYAEEMKEWRSRMLIQGDKKVLKALENLKGRGKELLHKMEEEGEGKTKETPRKKKAAAKKSDPKN